MEIDCKKLQKVGNRYYLVPSKEGEPLIALNETCRLIIDGLSQNNSVDNIVKSMCATYQVDEETVRQDVSSIISQMSELGIICS